MPKVKIEAKKVLDDIRAGLDEAALMEKYNLSIKGLHSVLEKLVALKALDESYIWTGKPAREPGHPSGNRELSAKEVTRDIKAGMTDGQLMRKYKLSSKGLQHLLEQLMEAGLIKADDLEIGKPKMESTVELTADQLASEMESTPDASDVTQPISAEIEAAPQPAPSPVSAKPAPAPPQVPPSSPEPSPPPVQPVTQAAPPTSEAKKTQEVYVTDTVEAAFPSTIPITIVARPEPEEAPPSPLESPAPPEAPQPAPAPEPEPREASQPEPTQDLWTTTERVTVRINDTPEDKAPSVSPEPPPPPTPEEKPRVQDFIQTLELVWRCPSCGHPQHQSYDECPACGIVVAKFLEQQKRVMEPEARIQEKILEPKASPLPVPEPAPPLISVPTPQEEPLPPKPEPVIKPRKSPLRPPAVQEGAAISEQAQPGVLPGMLTALAIAQLVVVLVAMGVQVVLFSPQSSTLSALLWSCGGALLISVVLAALLHASAVLVKLNREILAETAKNGHILKSAVSRKNKQPSERG